MATAGGVGASLHLPLIEINAWTSVLIIARAAEKFRRATTTTVVIAAIIATVHDKPIAAARVHRPIAQDRGGAQVQRAPRQGSRSVAASGTAPLSAMLRSVGAVVAHRPGSLRRLTSADEWTQADLLPDRLVMIVTPISQ